MMKNGQVRIGTPTDTELNLAAEPQVKYKN